MIIAGAILLAGVLIAGAILLRGKAPAAPTPADGPDLGSINIDVQKDEHIFGNADADIVIVEYSDTECPFCKRFHDTMHEVVNAYGDKVAWVYRHYPIPQLHQRAFNESLALECAWEQGGNDTFWKYTDEVYARTESNDSLEPAELPKIAADLGLNVSTFTTCLADGKYSDKVDLHMKSGSEAGVNGTPSSFIIKKGKVVDVIAGAEPFESVKVKLDKIVK